MDGEYYSDDELEALASYLPDDFTQEEFAHLMQDPELVQYYLHQQQLHLYQAMQQNYSVYHECVLPVASQAWDSTWMLLAFCLLLRLASVARCRPIFIKMLSLGMGLASLWKYFGRSSVYVLAPILVSVDMARTRQSLSGYKMAVISTGYLLACEFFMDDVEWNMVKGASMITLMKMVSLAFDKEMGVIGSKLSFLEVLSFILNPASLIFGPFIPYSDYLQLFKAHPLSIMWLINTLFVTLMSMAFLLWSSCGVSHYLLKLEEYSIFADNKYWSQYKEAMTFRSSHFYICFLSESTLLLMGICNMSQLGDSKSTNKDDVSNVQKEDKIKNTDESTKSLQSNERASDRKGNDLSQSENENIDTQSTDSGVSKDCNAGNRTSSNLPSDTDPDQIEDSKSKTQNLSAEGQKARYSEGICTSSTVLSWRYPVAHPLQVELPRSLVHIVTNWNLPMHYWLKQYIFKQTRKFGVFPAILITYFASAVLHSMNFQLTSVLLSIGVFAYIEHMVRHVLAESFSACIEARKCRTTCHHKHKENAFWVTGVNLMFSFVAMWNLAYLGCPFDSSGEEEKGYSMAHTLNTWGKYSYANHWIMLVSFLVQRLISKGSLFSF